MRCDGHCRAANWWWGLLPYSAARIGVGTTGLSWTSAARLGAAIALAGTLAGCGGMDMFSKDADWFAGRNNPFSVKSLTIENQALSTAKPVSPEELVSADGTCLGMNAPLAPVAPIDSNAQAGPADLRPGAQREPVATDPAAPAVPPQMGYQGSGGGIALGMSECEVARNEGIAANVVIGANERGERDVTLTYLTSLHPGIYRFTAGRLTSIDRAPEPPKPEKPQRRRRSSRR